MNENNPSNVPGQPNVDPTTNPPPNVGPSDLNVNQNPPSLEELQKQLADAQQKLAKFEQNNFELREKERQRKSQEAADKAALEQKLKEQGEWKSLAEQHEARVRELEPVQERYGALASVITEQITAQTKDWPKEVKDLLVGEEAPVDVRYAQVQKLQLLVDKMAEQQRGMQPGNSPGPRPAPALTEEQQRKAAYDKQRQTGHYPRF